MYSYLGLCYVIETTSHEYILLMLNFVVYVIRNVALRGCTYLIIGV